MYSSVSLTAVVTYSLISLHYPTNAGQSGVFTAVSFSLSSTCALLFLVFGFFYISFDVQTFLFPPESQRVSGETIFRSCVVSGGASRSQGETLRTAAPFMASSSNTTVSASSDYTCFHIQRNVAVLYADWISLLDHSDSDSLNTHTHVGL